MCDYDVPKGLDAFVNTMCNEVSWRRSAYTDGKYVINVMGREIDIFFDEYTSGYWLQHSSDTSTLILDNLHKCIVKNKRN